MAGLLESVIAQKAERSLLFSIYFYFLPNINAISTVNLKNLI